MARSAVAIMSETVAGLARQLSGLCITEGRVSTRLLNQHQDAAYVLAFLATEADAARAMIGYGELGEMEALLTRVAIADLLRSSRARLDGRRLLHDLRGQAADQALEDGSDPAVLEELASLLPSRGTGPKRIPEDVALIGETFSRFASAKVAPRAESVHRHNLDVPEDVIEGLAALGAFGMSIPTEYGGFGSPEDAPGILAMVVATEELSRGSLMAGSLLTRPEILVTALLSGGTEAQRKRWLPGVAAGRQMVAVAVTEPDRGSDVAGITTTARFDGTGYILNGAKMWATFAGRAELLLVLARTDPDRNAGARGLSLFVVEKPPFAGHGFEVDQPAGGRLEGRAIDTIGYRGLHSFELSFKDWWVPSDALIGGGEGTGRGFYLQMEAFAKGRLQTAARALGVMEGAFRQALSYARSREVFGRPLFDYQLTRMRLARMAARIQTGRRLTYWAAGQLGQPSGDTRAAMAKALTSRAAEEITRDAMQLHGGMGYAEESQVSRLFVDARVLSIFEGTEEVLALRVIARDLIERSAA
ncbi:MAG TPA: acyl-CoA dehydrogenase family protein [Acidimicrobiia bacterium]|nr:acyl-CoA dehydrogenase family protein [Acidimicrobiia bacterium]